MTLSVSELARARETVQGLLDELRLTAYQFEVEPRAEDWNILVECQADDAWQVTHVSASKTMLSNAQADSEPRQALLAKLRNALPDCSRPD
jgi:hypothetical protein